MQYIYDMSESIIVKHVRLSSRIQVQHRSNRQECNLTSSNVYVVNGLARRSRFTKEATDL